MTGDLLTDTPLPPDPRMLHNATLNSVSVDGPAEIPELHGIKLDPKKLKVRELKEIEQLLQRKVAEDMMTGLIGVDFLEAMLWMMMRRANPAITLEQVGDLDFEQVDDLIRDAQDDTGDPVAADAVDPPPAPNGNGNNAGSPVTVSSASWPPSVPSTT